MASLVQAAVFEHLASCKSALLNNSIYQTRGSAQRLDDLDAKSIFSLFVLLLMLFKPRKPQCNTNKTPLSSILPRCFLEEFWVDS